MNVNLTVEKTGSQVNSGKEIIEKQPDNAFFEGKPPEKSKEETPPLNNSSSIKKPKKHLLGLLIFLIILFLILGILIFSILKLRGSNSTTVNNKGDIVWWGIQHDRAVYEPLIKEFEDKNPGVKVKYEKQSLKDYRVRLKNAIASGTGPDIFEMHNSWPAMFKSDLSTLPGSVISEEDYSKIFYPVIFNDMNIDKGIVGIPLEFDALTLFINEEVFTSALKNPPETWSELQDLSTKLTQYGQKKEIIQGGVALGITENVDFWPEIIALMLYQNGINPARPISQAAADVFSVYKNFSKLKVWNSTLPSSTIAFARGELAMYFGPSKMASEIIKLNPNLKFRTVKLPQLPKNNPGDPNYSYATYWVQGVSEKSKVKNASWGFLKFLSNRESLMKLNENIIKYETFGRVFPRPDMNSDLVQNTILGSVVALAYDAKSSYLADKTNDGGDGINSQVNGLFKIVVDGWPSGGQKGLDKLSDDLSQLLLKYGVRIR